MPASAHSSSSSSAGGEPSALSRTPSRPDHRLLVPDAASAVVDGRPLAICFPGSGDEEAEGSSPAWMALAGQLVQRGHSVLLFARGRAAGPAPAAVAVAVAALRRDLAARGLAAPYVLVAHSYGGAFARAFVEAAPADVAGLVLAETGQEGGLDPRAAAAQLRRRPLGAKPLVVVRANSFLGVVRALEARTAAAGPTPTPAAEAALAAQRDLLRRSDAEDERLKRDQLRLSSTSKYVHLPDCGHHVVRDRPDIIADEVDWVFAHLRPDEGLGGVGAGPRIWLSMRKALARLWSRPKDVPCP